MTKTSSLVLILLSFLFLLGCLCYQKSHFLIALFCLEAIILTSSLFVASVSVYSRINSPWIILVILTLGACEARLGLSLLVKMSRISGSDIVNRLRLLKC